MFLEDSKKLLNEDLGFINIPYELLAEANPAFSRTQILNEKARIDFLLNNFMEEGQDYKDLKKQLREVCDLYSTDDEQLKRKSRKVLHIVKRFYQIYYDFEMAFGYAACLSIVLIPYMIIPLIMNRLMRLLVDTVEYNTLVKDTEDIISKMRQMKTRAKTDAEKKKIQEGIDKLERTLRNQEIND